MRYIAGERDRDVDVDAMNVDALIENCALRVCVLTLWGVYAALHLLGWVLRPLITRTLTWYAYDIRRLAAPGNSAGWLTGLLTATATDTQSINT